MGVARIENWAGLATAISPYVLPPGATVRQNNLQVLRPGELRTRPGIQPVYTAIDFSEVVGMYRVSNGTGVNDDLILCVRPTSTQTAYRYQRPIDTSAAVSWDTTTAAVVTTASSASPSFAEDRHGRIYAFQGSGVAPLVISRTTRQATDVGMAAPTVAPTVTPSGNGYFIERVDVVDGGGAYWAPPPIVITGGGTPGRAARLKTIIQGGSIVAVDVIDGGSGYTTAPTLSVDESGVKGVGFVGYGVIGIDPGLQGFLPVVQTTCTTSSTTNPTTLTAVSAIASIRVGMIVSGPGIQSSPATTVTAVNATNATVTISAAATASATGVTLTFNQAIRSDTTTSGWSHGFSISASSPSIAYSFSGTCSTASGSTTMTSIPTTVASRLQVGAVATSTALPSNTFVQSVDSVARTAVLSNAATSTTSTSTTFTQGAPASYDSATGTYSALIPVTNTTNSSTSAASAGVGAAALFTFSQIADGLSHAIGGTQDALWPVRPTGAMYGASASTLLSPNQTVGSGYYAQDYWRDTDTNDQYPNNWTSASFPIYQAHQWPRNNHDFFAGFVPDFRRRFHCRRQQSVGQDTVPGTPASRFSDMYVWDYSKISVRYYTGSRAELETGTDTEDKWVWTQVPVVESGGQPYIDIELVPAKKSGTTNYTQYAGYQTPIVRVFLKYCPDSWVSAINDNLVNLGWQRTASGARQQTSSTALGWWSAGAAEIGPAARPIVDFRVGSGSNDAAGLGAGTVQVIRAGAGMEQGTFFALQFDQVNAAAIELFYTGSNSTNGGSIYRPTYGQNYIDFDWRFFEKTPASPSYTDEYNQYINVARMNKSFDQYRQRLYFWANSPAAGQQGPPGPVTGNPSVVIPGTGYLANDRAEVRLRQRNNLTTAPAYSDSYLYTFTARQITDPRQTQSVTSVIISSTGANYYGSPELEFVGGGGGYGLVMDAVLSNGGISAVNVVSPGDGFTQQPTIRTASQSAVLIPVMRPAMRGTYRCAYRYADWSMTEIAQRTITTTSGSTTATISSAAGITPDMVIESDRTAFMSKVVSVFGTTLTLSRPATSTGTANAIVRDMSRPIFYSNFSPITDVDTTLFTATPNPTQMVWSVPGAAPPSRATVVEFFRTSSDQSLVFYRLEQYGRVAGNSVQIVGTDTLTDEDLFNADRPFYAAVPVVLPNGGLNAYRFGVPRTDMAVCAAYGDRLWYAVSTSGDKPNSVFFSEFDEFESCPAENEIAIQNNQKSTDCITGLIPFATYLLCMQNSHCYGLSYNTDPGVDASVQLLAHRGLLSQTCHDLCDNQLYAMDERGIYVLSRSGDVESLSEPIRDYFDNGLLDFQYRNRFFLKVDQRTGILRAFVVTRGSNATSPNMAFCYHIALKVWWTETWPNGLTCAVDYHRTLAESDEPVYGAVDGDVYRSRGVRDSTYRPLRSVTVVNGGSGYTTPPAVTVASGQPGAGASFTAILTNGAVSEILIDEPGFGYGTPTGGDTYNTTVPLVIAPPPSGTTATANATSDLPLISVSGTLVPPLASIGYAVRTGAMLLTNDGNANTRDALQDRSVTVVYRPTPTDSQLYLREFFNNSQSPRQNVMPRDRGTGFVHDTVGARTRLNMAAARSPLGTATGVAKAQFAGRNFSDMGGADRHVAVELSGPMTNANPSDPAPSEVLLYGLEVAGVEANGN